MPTRRINGPDGPIDFPAEMNDLQVEQAMQKLYPPHRGPELQLPALAHSPVPTPIARPLGPIHDAQGTVPEPSWYSKMAESVAGPEAVIRKGHEGWDMFSALAEATDTGNLLARGASTTLSGPVHVKGGVEEALAAKQLNPLHPGRPVAEGVARAGSGVFETLTPLMGAGAVKAPLLTAAGLIGAGVGSEAGERGSKALGASPEYQQLFGLLGAGAGGFATGGIEGWREYKSARVEDLFNQHVKAGMDPASARAAAEQGHDNYVATGNSKFLDPYNQQPTVGELEKGSIKGPAKVAAQQAASAAQGAASGALMKGKEDTSSQETGLTTKDLGLKPERPKAARPSPIPQPGPGSAEYEALKKQVANLDRPFTPVEEKAPSLPVEDKPDYLKRKLSLTRTGQTYVEPIRQPGPEEMAKRSLERYKDAMDQVRKLERLRDDQVKIGQKLGKANVETIKVGREERIEQIRGEALRHLRTWSQNATPEDAQATLNNVETPLRSDVDTFKDLLYAHTLFNQREFKYNEALETDPKLSRAAYNRAGKDALKLEKMNGDPERIAFLKKIAAEDPLANAKPEFSARIQQIVKREGGYDLVNAFPKPGTIVSMSQNVLTRIDKTNKVAEAIRQGKQIQTRLGNEINELPRSIIGAPVVPRLTEGGVSKRQILRESPPSEARPAASPVAAGGKLAHTPESIKEAVFNFAATASKAGKEAYGSGKFRVIEKAGKFRVEPITSAPEVSARPEVGRTEPTPEAAARPEPVQAAQASEGSREPVRATERPEIKDFYFREIAAHIVGNPEDMRAFARIIETDPNSRHNLLATGPEFRQEMFDTWLADKGGVGQRGEAQIKGIKDPAVEELERMAKLEHPLQKLPGSLRASDPSAQATINRDLERRGINPPGPSQGRRSTDPVTSEEVKSPDALIGQRLGPESVFESRVQQMMRKALGQGKPITRTFAERTVREEMEDERGSLSWRRINPGPNSTSAAGSNLLSALARFVSGPSGEEQTARNVMRSVFGERARAIDQLYTKFNEAIRAHEGDSVNDLIRFNNAAERKPGSSFLSPQDQALADSFQDIYQNILWPTLKQINPEKYQGAGIENYLGRLFPGKNNQIKAEQAIMARRPFEGGKSFSKHRIYQWIDESIAAGAVPITTNPIKMQTLVMNQIVKYISAHKAFENLKDRGLIEWVKVGKDRQPGWAAIDDSIFHPRVPMEGGLMEYGKYYAHPDVAKIFNRWLQPGLRGNALYDPIRNFADTQNMLQLGFSAFHFTFTSVAGAATSDVALGLQQAFNYGKPLKGIKSIAKGMTILPSMYDTYHLGNLMREEWTMPGTHPWLSKYADAMEDVGGGIGSQTLLANRQRLEKFKGLFGDGSYNTVKAVLVHGLPALAEFSSRPLMEKYVPNIKMGVFAKMAMDHYESLVNKGASQDEIRTALGRDWDSVDNRMGQVRYDNRFWNKVGRDIAQITIRSVGWNWGTVGEVFGGGADVGRFIGQVGQKALGLRPEKLELSSKAAYFMAMPAVIAGLGALMHYGLTGKAPEKLEDYIYPGPEGGKISLPTYARDVFGSLKHLPTTFVNKLHPMWAQLYATVFANEDFYHVEIRHPGDTPLQQAAELGKYLVTSNLPISWQSAYSRAKQEQNWPKAVALSEAGFTAAPKWVGQTPAQELIFDLSKRKWEQGPRTTAEYQKRQTMFKLRDALTKRKLTGDMIRQALSSGTVNVDDIMSVTRDAPMESYQREFKGITNLNDQIAVLKRAKPEEKTALKPYIHYEKLREMPPEDARTAINSLRSLFP